MSMNATVEMEVLARDLQVGDTIIAYAMMYGGVPGVWENWTPDVVTHLNEANYWCCGDREVVRADNHIMERVLRPVTVVERVVCACGRKVSGAMMAIGAVHLCP